MKRWLWLFFVLITSNCFADTILLKSGKTIEAKIVDKKDKEIKVDVQGVSVTYWLDEIEKINGEGVGLPAPALTQKEDSSSANELYQQAKNSPKLSSSSIDLIHAGNGVIDEKIQAALSDNQEAISLFKKAFRQKSDDIILGKMNEEMGEPVYFDDMELFGLILAQSYQYMANGQSANVEENLLTALKFINRLSQEKFGVYANIIRNTCFDIFMPVMTKVIATNSMNRQFYQSSLEQLNILANQDMSHIIKGEKEHILKKIKEEEDKARKEKNYNADFWSEFYRNFEARYNEFFQYQIEAFIKNNPEIYENKVKEIEVQMDKKIASGRTTPQSIEDLVNASLGDASLAANFLAYQGTSLKKNKNIAYYYFELSRIDMLELAVALKLYQLDNNKLPEDLSALSPKYLSEIPGDPFNNFQPIKYKKTDKGYLLYSLGPDREDQNGKINIDPRAYSSGNSDGRGDIVFSFE